MRLIIVRHGITEENVKRVYQGSIHGTLTEEGRRQIKDLALKLKDEKIDFIFSSDLKRAVDTTEEIAKFHKVPIYYTKELREKNGGVFEGRPKIEIEAAESEARSVMEFKPDGGESWQEFLDRIKKFTGSLAGKYSNDTLLISAHGFVARCLLSVYLHIPIEEFFGLRTYNTGILIIEVDGEKATKVKDEMFIYPEKK